MPMWFPEPRDIPMPPKPIPTGIEQQNIARGEILRRLADGEMSLETLRELRAKYTNL